MVDYHESWEALPEEARNVHRALASLKEEIEAVDWYHQRVVLCQDASLQAVLAHNRDEEIEHACMTLEWLRRNMPGWDQQLRAYLFSDAPITDKRVRAAAAGAASVGAGEAVGSSGLALGVGSLKGSGK